MKNIINKSVWIIFFAVFFFTACQEEDLVNWEPQNENENRSVETRAANVSSTQSLNNVRGIFVLSEGNMTSENGTLSFIDPNNQYKAVNWIYRKNNSNKELGNVAQDLFIANNKMYIVSQNGNVQNGAKHILIINNMFKWMQDFNPNEIFSSGWYGDGENPTHLVVDEDNIYVRTNNTILRISETRQRVVQDFNHPSKVIHNPSRTRMAMIKNNNSKYIYIGSESNKVYRIDTQTNNSYTIDSITIQGKVTDVVSVRRNNGAKQYIWVFSINSNGSGQLTKITGTSVASTYNIGVLPQLSPTLLIPYTGLCCDSRGTHDVLYFRGNNFYNGDGPQEIFKFEEANPSNNAIIFYTLPSYINPEAKVIYGGLGVDPHNGDVYFGYVGGWTEYMKVNGITRLGSDGNLIEEYSVNNIYPWMIDSRFTADIYFRSNFNL